MIEFLIALALFAALHSLPALPPVRARLIAWFGRSAYFLAYSIVSLLMLGWVFRAAFGVEFTPLWNASPWQAHVTLVAAPAGLFLVLAGLLSPNPLSISMRRRDEAGAIVAITRHPVFVGFLLWSAGHVVPNGDLRSVILFGSFALFALGGMAMAEKRARSRLGETWTTAAKATAIIPFSATLHRKARLTIDGPSF